MRLALALRPENRMKTIRTTPIVMVLGAIAGIVDATASGPLDPTAVRAEVDKIAAAVKRGEMDSARKVAGDLAKKVPGDPLEVLEELAVMDLFKKQGKGGDGIEVMLRIAARGGINIAPKEMARYEEAAYRIAAVDLVAEALVPKKDRGGSLRENWLQYSKQVLEGSEALAKAAKTQNGPDIIGAATKINNGCIACHAEWRNK